MKITYEPLSVKMEAWFNSHYPNFQWRLKDAEDFKKMPEIFKSYISTIYLEAQLCNGGLAQFLWNTFYLWEAVLNACEDGYLKMKAIPQVTAIHTFRLKILQNINVCESYIMREVHKKDMGAFTEWCMVAGESMSLPEEDLFFHDMGEEVDCLREKWIVSVADHILSITK